MTTIYHYLIGKKSNIFFKNYMGIKGMAFKPGLNFDYEVPIVNLIW